MYKEGSRFKRADFSNSFQERAALEMSLKESCRRAALASCAALLLVASAATTSAQELGWTGGRQGLQGKDLNAVYFVDSKRGWVAGDDGVVMRTRDGGRTWTRQTVETKVAFNDVYFRNEEDGYLLAGAEIFNTEDGGESWQAATRFTSQTFGGAEPELYSVRFTSKKRGWVVGSLTRGENVVDSLVLATDNGGASWQRQRVPVRDELIHLDFDGERRGWMVGSGGRILYTRDGGESWLRADLGHDERRSTTWTSRARSAAGWSASAAPSCARRTAAGRGERFPRPCARRF